MKTIHAIGALIFATLLVAAFSFAAEPEVKHHIKLKIATDDEMIDIDAADLEVGETRQSYTESGKEVLLTRLDEGYKLEVDGKVIDIGGIHGEGHGVHKEVFHFSGDEDAKVKIRTLGGEGGHKYAFIHKGDGDEDMHWVEKDGEDVDIFIERFSPADHLMESGVLDDLSEEKRQEILDALREMEPHKMIQKKIIVDVEEEVHEEGEDGDG